MSEKWLPAPQFGSLYEVSSLGRVRSLDRLITCNVPGKAPFSYARSGRILRQTLGTHGYFAVAFSREGKVYTRTVHRLVARAFLGEPPTAEHEAAHIDGDRTNNIPSNLCWLTRKENEAHKVTHGTLLTGERCKWSKVSASDVRDIRARCRRGEPQTKIAERYGISQGAVSLIHLNKNWKQIA